MEEFTKPFPRYYSKMFMALRLFKDKADVFNFWPRLRDIHPKKSYKNERKKWRILKNSLTMILCAKEQFQIHQDKFSTSLEQLSNLTRTVQIGYDIDSTGLH